MKEKWTVIAKDTGSPYLRNKIWTDSFYHWKKMFDLPVPRLGIVSRNNDIDYIALLSTWKKTGKIFFSRIEKDIGQFEKLIDKSVSWGEKMNQYTEKIAQADLKELPDAQLIKFYRKFSEMQAKEYAYGILLPLIDIGGASYLEEILMNFLKENASEAEFQEDYFVFTYPLHDSFAEEESKALLQLHKTIYKDRKLIKIFKEKNVSEINAFLKEKRPKILKKINFHTEKFAWVYYAFQGPALKEADFIAQLKDLAQKGINPNEELKRRQLKRRDIETKRKQCFKKMKPDAWTRKAIQLMAKVVWAKPRRKDYQSKSYYHIEKLMREFARRLNISLNQARAAPLEVLAAGLKGKPVDAAYLNEIERRHACLPTEKNKTRLYVGKQAEKFAKTALKKPSTSKVGRVKEFKGDCACPGKTVKGQAKIVNKPEDMAKMNAGDILVSIATTPSIAPAMKKAAAIVTDEGGLTCHAAIVSRELDKPCVVGTKFISKAVKDGDWLEVNALKGLVRKMKG